ncbi:MAG: RICIN domain-containing protein, partial [Clostridia bacterium]
SIVIHSNKSLDVSYGGQDNCSNVAQYQTHKGDTEQWVLKEVEEGYYNRISRIFNYLNLDIEYQRANKRYIENV